MFHFDCDEVLGLTSARQGHAGHHAVEHAAVLGAVKVSALRADRAI